MIIKSLKIIAYIILIKIFKLEIFSIIKNFFIIIKIRFVQINLIIKLNKKKFCFDFLG